MSPAKKPEGQRNVTIGNINGNRGSIEINTGDTIQARIEQAFSPVYSAIASRPNTTDIEKDDLKAEAAEVEAALKEKKVDENFVVRRLRNIGRMAPDILEVAMAAILNPAALPPLIAQKIAGQVGKK